jgi:oligoribonuclease (3'-5' exoribonuclease)
MSKFLYKHISNTEALVSGIKIPAEGLLLDEKHPKLEEYVAHRFLTLEVVAHKVVDAAPKVEVSEIVEDVVTEKPKAKK